MAKIIICGRLCANELKMARLTENGKIQVNWPIVGVVCGSV